MSEAAGERWEWYIWRDLGDGGDRPWQVWQRTSDPQESELIAEHLIRVDAEQIVAAHNAPSGGRERELREALLEACPPCRLGYPLASDGWHEWEDAEGRKAKQCALTLAMRAALDATPTPAQTRRIGEVRPEDVDPRRPAGSGTYLSGVAPAQTVEYVDAASYTILAVGLSCPRCGVAHLDEGEWVTRPHRTHLCLSCGHTWAVTVRGTAQTQESGLAELGKYLDELATTARKSRVTDPTFNAYDTGFIEAIRRVRIRYDALVAQAKTP